jgi:GT2 family glycosyltransferase
VVVDDASGETTGAVLARELERGDLPLKVVRLHARGGPATARERGWRAADCELVAFTDDDCSPHPDWLGALERAAAANPGCFVQGPTAPNPAERASRGPFSHTIDFGGPDLAFPTCNMAYPRELLERIDGFDTEIFGHIPGGEDCDLGWRAIEAGAQPVFAEDALVYHAIDNLGPLGKLRYAARWSVPMRAFAMHPHLRRRYFTHRIFWKRTHWLFFRALTALLVPVRWHPVRNWLMYPYLRTLWGRGKVEGGGLPLAPYFAVYDLVEILAVVRAAVRTRTVML